VGRGGQEDFLRQASDLGEVRKKTQMTQTQTTQWRVRGKGGNEPRWPRDSANPAVVITNSMFSL
jgi:hypothetical protein